MTNEQFGEVIREWKGRIESLRVPQTKKRKKKMVNETIENRVSGISKSLPFTTSVGPSARMTLQGSMKRDVYSEMMAGLHFGIPVYDEEEEEKKEIEWDSYLSRD